MHHNTRRLLPSPLIALAVTALACTLANDARAAAATPTGIVSSTASGGMIYAGTDGRNVVTVKLQNGGTRFVIDDVVPIQATAGCTSVPGDATKATCTAFKRPDGSLKEFHVLGRSGSDQIDNLTGAFPGASMVAHGEEGRDDLTGGSKADTLLGGPGDGDDLRGNGGPDILDGGPGRFDGVSYSNVQDNLSVSLDDVANDGTTSEGDNVKSTVEDIAGGDGDDHFVGSDADNVIVAGDGFDMLFGKRGADTLIGGRDNDFLSSNSIFTGIDDGAVDKLSGDFLFGDNEAGSFDSCAFSLADADIALTCEQF